MPSVTHYESGSMQDVQQCVCPSHHATEVNGLIGRAHMPVGVQVNGGLCSLLMSPNFVCIMTEGDCWQAGPKEFQTVQVHKAPRS
ncbi:hypothetical protein AVEN_199913-1 [Araneus ventricosus]|uniref:Uncharacterized protein n=1 Tax=Araneus ventricosus TaxID=182803 RepID=A0A4Y2S0U9_ARAVE|nr:hypothetical protein AVEN_199913-1 [Araneus ventricosus]